MKKSCAWTALFTLLVCLLLLFSPSFYASPDSSWSQYKSAPDRTGTSDHATVDNKGGLAWQWVDQAPWEDWHGFPTSCIIGPEGTIYFGDGENSNSGHGELIALNPNGTVKWSYDLRGEVLSPPAIGIDGSILVIDGRVNAVDPEGRLLWNLTGTYGAISGSPLVTDSETICVIEDGGGVMSISKDGSTLWEINDEGTYGTPAMTSTGGVVYTVKDNDNRFWIRTLDPDGSPAWSCGPFQLKITVPCVADNGTIYVGSEDGHVYAISPLGRVLWNFTTVGPVRGSPSLDSNGTVFACTGYTNGPEDGHWEEYEHQRLYAISGSGILKWYVEGRNFLASPSISKDNVFVTSGGRVVCYSMIGEELWSYTYWPLIDRWHPTSIAIGNDGTVYVEAMIAVLALGRGTPGQIQNLKGELWGKKLSLSWDEPESRGADTIIEYRIYVSHIIWVDPSSSTEPELLCVVHGDQRTFAYDNASLYDMYTVTAVNEYGESALVAHYYADHDQLQSLGLAIAVVAVILASTILSVFFLNRRKKSYL